MRAATVAAGGARWVWAGAAMRCDAMRRADGRCWLGRFGRAGSVWTAAEDAGAAAQCRRQRTRRIGGSRGSMDSITEETRAWLAVDVGVGDRLGVGGRSVESRCTHARRITKTRLRSPHAVLLEACQRAAQRPRKTNATPAVRRLQRRRSQRRVSLTTTAWFARCCSPCPRCAAARAFLACRC
jgi:hypothetical protein